jgi:hypothetical protein
MANIKNGINDEFVFTYNIPSYPNKVYKIPQGAYNITDLNKTLKEIITLNEGNADDFELAPNYNTLRARIKVKNGFVANFLAPTSIASLIGFKNENYPGPFDTPTTYDGEFPVNITDVNTILVNCSIASGSYSAKGSKGQTIYSFSPEVPPGSLMQINPRYIIYYPLNVENQINEVNMQLTDQTGRQLDLNNEVVTYYVHLRAITS